jgi:acetyl/propionyl-CoA carboxylase alpha subunit/acetyl-CoA carboxylase carboxyltransferase component
MNAPNRFSRVAVVNRGEAAVRFLRGARTWSALRRHPLEVVAFFTDADRDAPFVREADAAVPLGPALIDAPDGRRRSAYLDISRIVALLKVNGCDAVWPGWGFLSERPDFVDALDGAGIAFIGPCAGAMRRLGDKLAAKQLAEQHGVPVTAWSGGPVADVDAATRAAERTGYPLLVKAVAGGGGRGIRLVHAPDQLAEAFRSAREEAAAAFGDDTVILESLLPEARHVEVQVIADAHGQVFSLGTRDCSMQRRHQKVIEEAPAPGLTEAMRTLLESSAIRVARASGYVSAGTAEFLVTPDGERCFFLEMNTRLQVEHPVTESVTGLDLVGLQLDVAQGERLVLDVQPRGHAVEVRLNAEDPDARFAPSAGRILRLDLPSGPGIRVDSGYAEGSTVPVEFDSMLGKVIATGRTREEALARLEDALVRSTVAIEGGPSNRSILLELVRSETFRQGPVTTRWLDGYVEGRASGLSRPLAAPALVTAAILEHERLRRSDVLNFLRDASRGAIPATPPLAEPRRLRFRVGEAFASVEIATVGPRVYRIGDGYGSVWARYRFADRLSGTLLLEGRRYETLTLRRPQGIVVEVDGVAHAFGRASDGRVTAPVPAVVTELCVRPGDEVRAGQRVATLEVMKMELPVLAGSPGRVAELLVEAGVRVAAGDAIASIEEAAGEQGAESVDVPLFAALPGYVTGAGWGGTLGVLRGSLLGYDLPEAAVQRAVADLEERAPSHVAPLLDLVEIYVAREQLFRHQPESDGVAPVDALASYLRMPSGRGEGLSEAFLARLKRALACYEVPSLEPSAVLESALLRLAQAHRARDEQDAVLLAVLSALDTVTVGQEAPEGTRALLQSLAALESARNPRITDAAWTTAYLLCDRDGEVASGPEPVLPQAVEEEFTRYGDFDGTEQASPPGTWVQVMRARSDAGDVRVVGAAKIERLPTGRRRIERRYLDVLHAMREALAQTPGAARGMWNALVLSVKGAMPSDRPSLWEAVDALLPPTAGLGLQSMIIHGTTSQGEPVAVHWSAPSGDGGAITIGEPDASLIAPMGAYERRVAEARRRGLFVPYELVRVLAREDDEGPLPPGRFTELDLDGSGERLVDVDRPWGANSANLVVGLIENRYAPFAEGLRRVLVLGDPSRGMGSLAEPECRRLLAAFALAEAERLPVEWVPVSSGARIAWDSGTENLDWTARVLARIVHFTQGGGVVNVVVDGLCVGAQSYWNAEATMLQHCRGALVMTPRGAMLLTGKRALEFAGSVSAEDNQSIGGAARIMGPNGEAQYLAPDFVTAYEVLFRHYALTHVMPGEPGPRRLETGDAPSRDAMREPYAGGAEGFERIGDLFDAQKNPDRKKPFAIRSVMRAVLDADIVPLERWRSWQGAESAVVFEGSLGGRAVTCIGIESRPVRRRGDAPADGPEQWTAGTLFPRSSKKVARAIGAASGVKPVVVLANLSGFDGSPESLRELQLEYGAEIGRAVVNFRGPLVFCVVSRYHGGAYVVFSQALNPGLKALALEGSYASVIGGAPAAAVVFPGLVRQRALEAPQVVEARAKLGKGSDAQRAGALGRYEQLLREATSRAQAEVAREFDAVHSVERALKVGSLSDILSPSRLREALIDAVESGVGRFGRAAEGTFHGPREKPVERPSAP